MRVGVLRNYAHLHVITAHHMLDWEEKLRSHLGLTEVDVHDIKAVHGSNPGLQRYVAGLDMQDFI